MRVTHMFFSVLGVFMAICPCVASVINTEDQFKGSARIEEHLSEAVQMTDIYSDKDLLKAEKRQVRFEKRVGRYIDNANNKLASSKNKNRAGDTSGKNTMSLLSLIGGVGGFLLIFIPYIAILGLLMGIAGFVLGLIAMKQEGSNVMNILGVVFGALTILLLIAAVIIVASLI